MNSLQKLVKIIQEDVIGSDNRFIAMAWLACISCLVGLGFYLSSESMSFLGVADSRESQINFEYPVEIKRVHVIPGQIVQKGDLLLELNQSELNTRIRTTRSALAKLRAELKVRDHLNSIVSNSSDVGQGDPLSVDIADLSTELELLETQKKNLYVFAQISGIVGAVNFKRGEKVPAFTSVVTLSPEHPTYVEGFVHESMQTKLEIGAVVAVKPVSSNTPPLEGKVVSVGSRIIQIPTRLMHYPNMQVWGREVVVEIPPRSGLLLGEKVQIKPSIDLLSFPTAIAATGKSTAKPTADKQEPLEMRMPAQFAKNMRFEPSGAIYLEDLKKFLVVSDDTDKNDSPILFLVDQDGNVDDQTLLIPGLSKISDMESISQSDGYVYVMASQGLNKDGEDKKSRNLFVRSRRSGLDLSATESVEFKPLLLKALKKSVDKKITDAMGDLSDGDIDVESHFVDGDEMYIGFKLPQGDSKESIVLEIKGVDAIFANGKIEPKQLVRARTIDFGSSEGGPHRLSDLVRVKGSLYASTVCKGEDCGAVWRLKSVGGKLVPEQIQFFSGLKPEGIAFDPQDSSLFVTFDRSEQAGKFARVPL